MQVILLEQVKSQVVSSQVESFKGSQDSSRGVKSCPFQWTIMGPYLRKKMDASELCHELNI